MHFPKQYVNVNICFLVTQQVYMHLQHLETLNMSTSVTLKYSITSFLFLSLSLVHNKLCKKYDYSATCIGLI